jgi:very-short-patch-repair endonuclease
VAELAQRQHGVVARWQLVGRGLERGWIEQQLQVGWFHRVFRGVYAVGHPAIGRNGRAMAAVLAYGPDAYLSHRWAARHLGLLDHAPSLIDVVVMGNHRPQRGIRIHRVKQLNEREHTIHNAIPITTVPRTLLDLAAIATKQQLRHAANEAARNDWLDKRAIDQLIDRHRGRKGMTAFRAVIDAVHPQTSRTRSDLEAAFLNLCRRHRLPEPIMNTEVEGFLVDAHFPGTQLIVELDFWDYHRTRMEFARDRMRDAALSAQGYEVCRAPDEWLDRDPAGLAETLRRLLERCRSERLAPGEARFEVVPEGDLVLLALHPAEVDLAPFAQRGEIHEAAGHIADHDLHLLQLEQR